MFYSVTTGIEEALNALYLLEITTRDFQTPEATLSVVVDGVTYVVDVSTVTVVTETICATGLVASEAVCGMRVCYHIFGC